VRTVSKALVVAGTVTLAAGLGLVSTSHARPASGSAIARGESSSVDPAGEPWRADQLIEPAELARELTGRGKRPVVLYVGYPLLYAGGHIPGAHYLGPASTVAGLRALQEATKKLPADGEVVLYCGCCPMDRCPNIRPAFRLMEQLRFINVKVLDIAVNFPQDWTRKGYPVEKGGLPRGAQSS
jgi:thiosulfate/3-mercaptopyruvate sulfurtransferase